MLCPVTGDRPFPGGVGTIWEPGAFEQLLGDVTNRVLGAYGDDTVVCAANSPGLSALYPLRPGAKARES